MAHKHYILHKPYNCLSQFITNQKKRKNIRLLGDLYAFPKGTMAIGRLDKDSEGLLFLSTDGQMSEMIRGRKFEKEYYVQVDGEITEVAIQKLMQGVEIGFDGKKYQTRPCKASKLSPAPLFGPRAKMRADRHGPKSWLTITINEGKFRQVRKMTAAVGFPTLRLIRGRIGEVVLGDLKEGAVMRVDSFLKGRE